MDAAGEAEKSKPVASHPFRADQREFSPGIKAVQMMLFGSKYGFQEDFLPAGSDQERHMISTIIKHFFAA